MGLAGTRAQEFMARNSRPRVKSPEHKALACSGLNLLSLALFLHLFDEYGPYFSNMEQLWLYIVKKNSL